MSGTDDTNTTMTFDGKQLKYQMYRIQRKGEFMAKGVQAALRLKFGDLLPASENTSGQTAKQQLVVGSNIIWMGLLIRAVNSADLLAKIESMVSEDWRSGCGDRAMAKMDKKFCLKDTMAKTCYNSGDKLTINACR